MQCFAKSCSASEPRGTVELAPHRRQGNRLIRIFGEAVILER
jgi:hypothetical protein